MEPRDRPSVERAVLARIFGSGAERDGALKPGVRLTTRELMSTYAIPLTMARDAILRLVDFGVLVPGKRGRGTAVADVYCARTLTEGMEVRAALESGAARLCARRATVEDLELMEQLTKDLERAKDASAIVRLDQQWHEALVRSAANETVRAAVYGHWSTQKVISIKLAAREIAREHAEVLAAIRGRDEKSAGDVMWLHLARPIAMVREQARAADFTDWLRERWIVPVMRPFRV